MLVDNTEVIECGSGNRWFRENLIDGWMDGWMVCIEIFPLPLPLPLPLPRSDGTDVTCCDRPDQTGEVPQPQ